jgi:hypothetical protein
MRDPTRRHHEVPPFGSGYRSDARGNASPTPPNGRGGAAKWTVLVVGALALGITTAAAITKSRAPASDVSWSHSSNFVKIPFAGGFEDALY